MLGWALNLGFAGGGGAIVWTSIGPAKLYTSGSFVYESYFRATSGTVFARAIDNLANPVGQVETSSATFARVRSGTLSLVAGRDYRTQVGKIGADAGELLGSSLEPV